MQFLLHLIDRELPVVTGDIGLRLIAVACCYVEFNSVGTGVRRLIDRIASIIVVILHGDLTEPLLDAIVFEFRLGDSFGVTVVGRVFRHNNVKIAGVQSELVTADLELLRGSHAVHGDIGIVGACLNRRFNCSAADAVCIEDREVLC